MRGAARVNKSRPWSVDPYPRFAPRPQAVSDRSTLRFVPDADELLHGHVLVLQQVRGSRRAPREGLQQLQARQDVEGGRGRLRAPRRLPRQVRQQARRGDRARRRRQRAEEDRRRRRRRLPARRREHVPRHGPAFNLSQASQRHRRDVREGGQTRGRARRVHAGGGHLRRGGVQQHRQLVQAQGGRDRRRAGAIPALRGVLRRSREGVDG